MINYGFHILNLIHAIQEVMSLFWAQFGVGP